MVKKIILFFSLFLIIFINISYADGEITSNANADRLVDIDISKIVKNFNKSSYVKSLKKLGVSVKATQNSDKSITLAYDNVTIKYNYKDKKYVTTYPINNVEIYKKCNILSALFIDCISTMQGNPEGSQIGFALDDSFCYSTLEHDGIAKNYVTENNQTVSKYEILPDYKLSVLSTNNQISENVFLLESNNFYEDVDCIVKSQDLVFYRTFSKDGKMELYIGNPNELSDYAYGSMMTAISLLFNDPRAAYYISKDYTNFSMGHFELEGVSIDTNINKLPTNNVDTVLLPKNMAYAKLVIDRDVLNSKLDSVELPKDNQTENSKNSDTYFFIILSVAIVLLIIAVVIIRQKNKKSN